MDQIDAILLKFEGARALYNASIPNISDEMWQAFAELAIESMKELYRLKFEDDA